MARKQGSQSKGVGRLRSVASAVKTLFTRGRGTAEGSMESRDSGTRQSASRTEQHNTTAQPGRVTRRETDIPLDLLDRSYNPPNTSSKASFRSDGNDHHSDQEFAMGSADERWNDEDRFTNKSGDPRIGTHRRTYEPAEARTESRE
jgi:hypothetical protein